jgi:hypothetical protein
MDQLTSIAPGKPFYSSTTAELAFGVFMGAHASKYDGIALHPAIWQGTAQKFTYCVSVDEFNANLLDPNLKFVGDLALRYGGQ